MPEIRVGVGVAALIFQKDKLLMIKRQGAHGAGKWSVPGGWVEKGETILMAAQREVREEVGIKIDPKQEFGFTQDFHPEGVQDVCFWIWCMWDGATPYIREKEKISELRWMNLEELIDLDLFTPLEEYFVSGQLGAVYSAIEDTL